MKKLLLALVVTAGAAGVAAAGADGEGAQAEDVTVTMSVLTSTCMVFKMNEVIVRFTKIDEAN